jgi:hypothetical protein
MAKISVILISIVVLNGCATASRTNEDSRLEVQAAMATRQRGPNTAFLYIVSIRNVSERTLFLRRVEVEPIGGGRVRTAYAAPSRDIEPGEQIELSIWAELDPKETVLGVGNALARIVVAFDDGMEKVLGTYLVQLK